MHTLDFVNDVQQFNGSAVSSGQGAAFSKLQSPTCDAILAVRQACTFLTRFVPAAMVTQVSENGPLDRHQCLHSHQHHQHHQHREQQLQTQQLQQLTQKQLQPVQHLSQQQQQQQHAEASADESDFVLEQLVGGLLATPCIRRKLDERYARRAAGACCTTHDVA
eukprot:3989810-Pleurochrysis_carterae.AAC.1